MYTPSADDVIGAVLFPPRAQQNVQYLRSQFDGIHHIADQRERQFKEQAQAAFSEQYSAQAQAQRDNILRDYMGMGLGSQTSILELSTIDELSMASAYMQPWIMALPQASELHHKQRIDGYSSTYVDANPGQTGWHNPYYRAATNGMYVEHGENAWLMQHWDDQPVATLSMDDQVKIHDTWSALAKHLDAKELDPTSAHGDEII